MNDWHTTEVSHGTLPHHTCELEEIDEFCLPYDKKQIPVHGIPEIRAAMHYSVPHGIDVGRGSVNLGITAPRLAQQIPNNLLAVEVRKSGNHQPLAHDQHKLRALTDPHLWFAYWIGVFVTLGNKQVTAAEVYTSWAKDEALSNWFADRIREVGLSVG